MMTHALSVSVISLPAVFILFNFEQWRRAVDDLTNKRSFLIKKPQERICHHFWPCLSKSTFLSPFISIWNQINFTKDCVIVNLTSQDPSNWLNLISHSLTKVHELTLSLFQTRTRTKNSHALITWQNWKIDYTNNLTFC